ncbi:MAG: acyltransferase family protein [Dermatophilaceae bacterium]
MKATRERKRYAAASRTAGALGAAALVEPPPTVPTMRETRETGQTSETAATPSAAPVEAAARHGAVEPLPDAWLTTLGIAALMVLVSYRLYGWAWSPLTYASFGVLFAVAGARLSGLFARERRHYAFAMRRYLLGVVAPLWAFGLVFVPLMLWWGWTSTQDGTPLAGASALLWMAPISTPPASDLGVDWVSPAWYVGALVWLVLLSQPLAWLFGRWPIRTLLVPFAVAFLAGQGILTLGGAAGAQILTVCAFVGCWLAGFAYESGRLHRSAVLLVAFAALLLGSIGLWWSVVAVGQGHASFGSETPAQTSLFSFGVVVLALRLGPRPRRRFDEPRSLDRVLRALDRRFVTVYLWSATAATVAMAALTQWTVTSQVLAQGGLPGALLRLVATLAVVAVFAAGFGWVEEMATSRALRTRQLSRRQR